LLSIRIKFCAVKAGFAGTSRTVSRTVFMYYRKQGKSLLIRFTHDGKPYSFSLPKHNNPIGEARAKQIMAQIEQDIVYGNFDTSLLTYKPRKLGKNPTDITAVELIEKYIADRQEDLANGSIVRLKAIASKLSQLLGDKPAEKVTELVARDAIARWSETATSRSIKTYLFLLRACWDWAKGKYHIAESNPWSACLECSKYKRKTAKPKPQKPFTIGELQEIVAAFKADRYYTHYTDFVFFLASVATRPGEAIGLRWEDINSDYSIASVRESISRGHQNLDGTKTGKCRTVNLPDCVRAMLADRKQRLNPRPEDLVFPAPRGGSIDDHNFCNRAWKKMLASRNIEYRTPYNLRHSAISHALHHGASPVALAEQTGHSVRVLLSTYAHATRSDCLFVDLGKLETW
jgi:integrase